MMEGVNTTAVDGQRGELDDETSVQLMLRVQQGDVKAFEALVAKHHRSVIGVVAKMLGGSSAVVDAEDVAQMVFIRVWKGAKNYQAKAKFTTWLFTITRNLVFNETRRRNRLNEVSVEQDSAGRGIGELASEGGTPVDEMREREVQEAIDKAIAGLPEVQRLALVLKRYEDLSYEEIGEVLGLSLSAVKSHLFRARSTLREELRSFLQPV